MEYVHYAEVHLRDGIMRGAEMCRSDVHRARMHNTMHIIDILHISIYLYMPIIKHAIIKNNIAKIESGHCFLITLKVVMCRL